MLSSVRHLIDEYYIIDTGSTDNTVKEIESAMKDIPGAVGSIPFVDFGQTRNAALQEARTHAKSDWFLILDADMVIHGTLSKAQLTDILQPIEAANLIQMRGRIRYPRTCLISRSIDARYEGRTHEVLKLPPSTPQMIISEVLVVDTGDGGSKHDKLERDLKLLSNPVTTRDMFYLAETQRYSGNLELACQTYQKRIDMGGGKQELFYSAYQIGRCMLKLDREQEARRWMEISVTYCNRAEPFYHLACWNSAHRNWSEASIDIARSLCAGNPDPSWLFVEVDVYEYLREVEKLIIEYYTKTSVLGESLRQSKRLLDKQRDMSKKWQDSIYRNTYFFSHKVRLDTHLYDFQGECKEGFFWSTPTCAVDGEKLVVIARINNYHITETGEYKRNDNFSECRTIHVETHEELQPTFNQGLKAYPGRKVRGLEDVRLFKLDENMLFTAVTEDMIPKEGLRRMTVGYYEHPYLSTRWILASPYDSDFEKNWAFFSSCDRDLKCVYRWYPLEVGTICLPKDSSEGYLDKLTQSYEVPGIFRYMRGSSHGCIHAGLVWFVTHSVCMIGKKRHYMHYLVALEPTGNTVVGYGGPYRLTEKAVEFCNGLTIASDSTMIICYSSMDSSCHVGEINIWQFLGLIDFSFC